MTCLLVRVRRGRAETMIRMHTRGEIQLAKGRSKGSFCKSSQAPVSSLLTFLLFSQFCSQSSQPSNTNSYLTLTSPWGMTRLRWTSDPQSFSTKKDPGRPVGLSTTSRLADEKWQETVYEDRGQPMSLSSEASGHLEIKWRGCCRDVGLSLPGNAKT